MFSKQHLPIILKLIGLLSIVVVVGISMFDLTGAAVMFTATKTDTLVIDNDHDGIVDPGDTLEYTVVVQNTGDQTATNVNFSDTLDANTTLTGPVHVSPLAFKDSYTSLGNVGITVNAANGVLANDIDPDSNVSLSVTANAGGTTQGGTFAIAADGSFSYRPPTGFEGIDTFSYTLSDGDSITPNDTETVTITVNEVIWFIDNSATGPGAGQLSDPFNSIANFNNLAADEAGDIIFIYETGSGVYTGDIALLSNQTVIGQGASASIAAITGITVPPFSNAIPSTGGSRPVLGNSFVGVRIQANNTLSGFDIGNTPFGGAGIANLPQNVSFGALTISDMAIGGAGRAILLLGDGTLDVTLDSVNSSADVNGLGFLGTTGVIDGKFTVTGATTIDDTDNIGINIFNSSATYDFGNTSITNVGVNQAVNITSSPSGSFTFDALTITTDNGPGLFANGGAVNVTGSANTINATNGPAVSLTNTTIGTSGITFRSVSANNAANGIVLNNTGSGSFSVTGVGATAGSGGTIQNISGSGVNLISAQNVSLANMNLTNTAQSPAVATGSATCDDEDSGTNTGCNAAVYMHNTTNTTLVGLIINDSNQHGLNGNNVNGLTVQNTAVDNIGDGSLENGLAFINLLGSVVFSNL
ncbi:MAG: cadherin-like domain-containing protein, partial [Anaerolineae bacterium]|nr:cadherin-like domain-containing protein [Anaerolineae bacterium]